MVKLATDKNRVFPDGSPTVQGLFGNSEIQARKCSK